MSVALGALAAVNFTASFLEGVKKSNEYMGKAENYLQQADDYRRNAAQVRLSGALNEDISRAANRAYMAKAAAAAGEAGMGESPTMVSAMATTAAALEQNVLNQRYQIESAAENYLYQANVSEQNAKVMKKKSGNAFTSGLINGISSSFSAFKF